MTEASLKKKVDHFKNRVEETKNWVTPRQKASHTLAKNKLGQSLRQLLCFQETGRIGGWHRYPKQQI